MRTKLIYAYALFRIDVSEEENKDCFSFKKQESFVF
jgi:hypothetical protein